jgi:LytS/YehU family sensor histidine kinase
LYVIYENNQPSVRLGKELQLVEEYVEMEKTGVENLTVAVRITGNVEDERIAPFIILPLVENGFRQLSQLDIPSKTISLDLRVAEGSLYMKLAWSKPIDSSTLANGNNLALQNIGKRLNLLYPQSHELKVVITTDHFIVDLRIELHRAIN